MVAIAILGPTKLDILSEYGHCAFIERDITQGRPSLAEELPLTWADVPSRTRLSMGSSARITAESGYQTVTRTSACKLPLDRRTACWATPPVFDDATVRAHPWAELLTLKAVVGAGTLHVRDPPAGGASGCRYQLKTTAAVSWLPSEPPSRTAVLKSSEMEAKASKPRCTTATT